MDNFSSSSNDQIFTMGKEDSRVTFLKRTYSHLFGAILAFTLFEVILFKTGVAASVAGALLSVNWLFVLGGFMAVSWFARSVAYKSESIGNQYLALAGYVIAEGLIFVPLLYVANMYAPGVIESAAVTTLMGFTGLTAIVFFTKKDFSFLGALLKWGGVGALVLIASAVLFGLELGTFFSVGMVFLAGAAILYDTSKIMHDFPENRYVGAALELFASVALMFWYILQLFMSRD